MDSWICQTPTASPAEPGRLPTDLRSAGSAAGAGGGVAADVICLAAQPSSAAALASIPSAFSTERRSMRAGVSSARFRDCQDLRPGIPLANPARAG